jgi:hypothetical protein
MKLKAVAQNWGPNLFAPTLAAMNFAAGALIAQPTITSEPASQTVLAGSTVLFSVAAQGVGPLSYQWQFDGTNLPNDVISTVVGTSHCCYSGDGGPATNARVEIKEGMAFDIMGNLYLPCDNRIRKVDTNGIITTVAGSGSSVFSGDGGAATNAGIYQPIGVALDNAGNLFIDDVYAVRKVGYTGYPTLTLNQVTASDAGSYTAVVTSAGGSITSEVATLTVQFPPSISSITPESDGTVALSFAGTPDSTNRLWVATSLGPPAVWFPLSTNVAGPDGTWRFTDSSGVGWASRFDRVSMS